MRKIRHVEVDLLSFVCPYDSGCFLLCSLCGARRINWVGGKSETLYEVQEEGVRAHMDKKIRNGPEIAKAEGRTIEANGQKALLEILRMAQYQYLIDRMVCIEEELATKLTIDLPTFQRCSERRVAASMEYFRFAGSYGDQFAKEWNACQAKTRLFNLEVRYPPFPFMRTVGQEFRAYDSASLLACVKSRI